MKDLTDVLNRLRQTVIDEFLRARRVVLHAKSLYVAHSLLHENINELFLHVGAPIARSLMIICVT